MKSSIFTSLIIAYLLVFPALSVVALDTPPRVIKGTVLLPDGQPAADAPVVVYFFAQYGRTRTTDQGEFELQLDPQQIVESTGADDWKRIAIAAGKKGYGADWELLRNIRDGEPITLTLTEDLAITGRILDQQGRPIRNAVVQLLSIHGGEDKIDGFLRTNRDDPVQLWIYEREHMKYLSPNALPVVTETGDAEKVVLHTDESGAFELNGIGRERSCVLHISGPDIVSENIYVVTRPEIDARWLRGSLSRATRMYLESGAVMPTVYAASFRHLAQPGMEINGTVKDARTGDPVEGMAVQAQIRGTSSGAATTTDAQGRYRIGGLKTEGELTVSVLNPGDKPWLDASRVLQVRTDQRVGEIDFQLSRGVLVRGRVTHSETDEPVRGWVTYLAWPDNPELDKLSEQYDSANSMMTKEDGTYEIVVPAGPGVLTFQARDNKFEFARPEDFGFALYQNGTTPMFSSANMGLVMASNYHALKRIEPATTVTELSVDLSVTSGQPISVRIINPDGTPVEGLIAAMGLFNEMHHAILGEPKASIRGLQPGEQRTVFFRDQDRRWAAIEVFEMPRTGTPEEITVRLEPCGTISGRIVDSNGRPLSQHYIGVMTTNAYEWYKGGRQGPIADGAFEFSEDIRTDADGFFRVAGIPSGVEIVVVAAPAPEENGAQTPYLLHTGKLRSGQQLDLDEIKVDRDQ